MNNALSQSGHIPVWSSGMGKGWLVTSLTTTSKPETPHASQYIMSLTVDPQLRRTCCNGLAMGTQGRKARASQTAHTDGAQLRTDRSVLVGRVAFPISYVAKDYQVPTAAFTCGAPNTSTTNTGQLDCSWQALAGDPTNQRATLPTPWRVCQPLPTTAAEPRHRCAKWRRLLTRAARSAPASAP